MTAIEQLHIAVANEDADVRHVHQAAKEAGVDFLTAKSLLISGDAEALLALFEEA